MNNETFALQAITYWYNAVPIAVRLPATRDRAIANLRKSTTFMDKFGAEVRKIPSNKTKAAMESLGRSYAGILPSTVDMFNAIAAEVAKVSAADVAKAAADGVKDAGKFVMSAAMKAAITYAAFAAIGAFVLPVLLKEISKSKVTAR